MSRNKSLTMRYSKEFLLAVDGPGIVLKSLLSNPSTEYWVLSGKDAAAFPVRPGGIRVLPTEDFSPLLSSMRGNLQSATEDKLGEDLARERKQEGSPAEKRLLARRRLSPVKLPGLRMDASAAQQGLGMQRPERSELALAHSATEGSFKALQEQQLIGGMPKESEKGGSPAEKRLLARRRLSPVKLPGLRMDTSVAQQGLGMQPPERVLPATEGRASKKDKSKTAQPGSHKAESPVCKGYRTTGQRRHRAPLEGMGKGAKA
ncbi:uncharacterized protein [Struthio camelus]|uniref:uncharacterized protein n=1 Tax=Struthio camelus TaxID=8801 RepID=UPI003603BEEC